MKQKTTNLVCCHCGKAVSAIRIKDGNRYCLNCRIPVNGDLLLDKITLSPNIKEERVYFHDSVPG